MTFTKLFSSITESSVWCQDDQTRLVWITMLAMADRLGRVWASVPGLANRARVSVESAEKAIKCFSEPDPYSRTKNLDGRRIEEIDGGWRLLNYAKYRSIRDEEAILESKRKYINTRRAVENVDRSRHIADADADAKQHTQSACAVELPSGFPKSEEEATRSAAFAGCPEDFASVTYHLAVGRGGRDSKDVPIRNWCNHLRSSWVYQQNREASKQGQSLTRKPRTGPPLAECQDYAREKGCETDISFVTYWHRAMDERGWKRKNGHSIDWKVELSAALAKHRTQTDQT